MISVYNRKTNINISTRRIELLRKYNEIIRHGREDPVWFIETILQVPLLDYQKWMIMSAWTKQTVVFLCSRNTGKSFIVSLYIMTRAILFPSQKIWIMSGTASQAQDTFKKMEDIAKHNISSLKNDSDVFQNELSRAQANSDGWLHGKDCYSCKLYNGSEITTLVGKAESVIGKRSNLSVYDEAGIISEEFMVRTLPFTTQSSAFVMGDGIDTEIYPSPLPNQNLYLSSASDTSGALWKAYKDCAKSMLMGLDDCFVADIGCEIPLNPTRNGKKVPPLFERSAVDTLMRSNPYRALREYYNIFDKVGGTDCLVGRDTILRNEQPYLPVFHNNNPDAIYGIFYDPAAKNDNSFVLIGEFTRDEEKGWTVRLINGINLIMIMTNGDKKPLRATEQLEWIRNLLIKYNGENVEYTKVKLWIDAGSGGGGPIYGDFLVSDWVDKDGISHCGIIDMEDEKSKEIAPNFPRAIKNVLSLPTPQKYRSEMFEALSQMTSEDLITFPQPLPVNGSGKVEIDGKKITLSREETRALLELDLLKEEVLMMRKTKTEAGNIKYSLPPDKVRTAHDDRAYCAAMCALFLQNLRRDDFAKGKNKKSDFTKLLNSIGNGGKNKSSSNPFGSKQNPFTTRGGFRR